jgi:hypothetical protein
MPTTSPDDMIAAIVATLNAALEAGGGTSTGTARIGRLARERARTGISIVWDDAPRCTVEPPVFAGGNARGETEKNNPRIHSVDHARYEVIVRAGTRAATRTMFENLLAASHLTYPNRRAVKWGGYSIVPDEFLHDGWAIIAQVEISMALTDTIIPIITLEGFDGDVLLMPEEEDVGDLPGPYAPEPEPDPEEPEPEP